MADTTARMNTGLSVAQAERTDWDVLVVGAGHNGLVAGLVLAKSGLDVLIVEERTVVGGAVRTERPFAKAPGLATSTGAYLLGLMQPELMERLDLELPLIRRDPHYFLPTTDGRYLLFGSDERDLERQFVNFFSERDFRANREMTAELAALREDIAPTWLEEPLSIEDTAERYVRKPLREVFIGLCRGSVGNYLERFDFRSDLVKAMYAVTDGFSGLFGTWDTPGSGMNFLVHNMCRLKGSGGTWMVVQGGMGTVTGALERAFREAGGSLMFGSAVERVVVAGGTVWGVQLEGKGELSARAVVAGCDPFRLRELVSPEDFPADLGMRLDGMRRPGSTFKLNLALERLPTFSCLPQNRGQFGPTIHLLPDEADVLSSLTQAFESVRNGRLPEFPSIEWYIHSTVDPSLTDSEGRLSSALFVQWVPYELAESNWDDEVEGYSDHLLALCDRFAPGTSRLVVDRMPLHPKRIEQYFGIRHGHIHHIDNTFGFADRFPHRLPIPGVYSCSAGTHPAGSVIGSAGYIAAQCLLADLNR
jgi:phytoene dehydrogenase-like protein